MTDHFERHRPDGPLLEDEAATRRAARGTTVLRLRVERFEARAKLNKPAEVTANITARVAEDNPALAQEMRRRRTSRT